MTPQQKPTLDDVAEAIFGKWEGQKRKRGLLERVGRIEIILAFSVPILVARALGVPTDLFGKFFTTTGGVAVVMQHLVALFVSVPK